nr:NUDIX hydrolase 12, mitochondrial-like [Tanacetum cinerariifolium]
MSATEAEYIDASEAATKAVWIRKFISGLGIVPTINKPIKMLCDNSVSLLIANEPGVEELQTLPYKISLRSQESVDEHDIGDEYLTNGYLTEKEQHQLLLDEEALREMLEEAARADKEQVKFKDQNSIEVLMVSSPNRDDMVFPKGGWESDETVEEAACREALEEAGVRGVIKGNLLGVWEFRSKTRQEAGINEGGCKGYMFALEVTEVLEAWPERNNRDRKWVVIDEAFVLCRYEWMRDALTEFSRVIKKGKNRREHEVVVETKDNQPVKKEDDDCQLASTNCHVNGTMTMSTSYGIMLPASIFLEFICTLKKLDTHLCRDEHLDPNPGIETEPYRLPEVPDRYRYRFRYPNLVRYGTGTPVSCSGKNRYHQFGTGSISIRYRAHPYICALHSWTKVHIVLYLLVQ